MATLSTTSQEEEREPEEPMDSQTVGEGDVTVTGGAEGYMSTEEDSPPPGTQSSQGSVGTEHRAAFLREIFRPSGMDKRESLMSLM